jgi:hypothetical protein
MRSFVRWSTTSALVLGIALAILSWTRAAEPPASPKAATPARSAPSKPQPKITVSKETTFVLGPLRDDGLPDFDAALNELAGKGITAENNAAVLFWQAIGPGPMGEHREKIVKTLGMAPLADDGDYLISLRDFAWRRENNKQSQPRDARLTPLQLELDSQQHKAFDRPWNKKEFPLLAEWLDANQKALKLIDDGSRRQRFFSPEFPFPFRKLENILTTAPRPNLNVALREALSALETRAMLRVASDDVDGALDDALTCHHLARLYGTGATLADMLLAIALDGHASSMETRIAEYGKVSTAQNARLQRELETLIPLKISDAVSSGDRIFWLGAICQMKDDPRNNIVNMLAPFPELMSRSTFNEAKALSELAANQDVDWNVVLRRTNAYYDHLSMALAKPNYRERTAALTEVDKWVASLPGPVRSKGETPGKPTHADVSEAVADSLVKYLSSTIHLIAENEAQHQTWLAAGRTCIALAAYRSDHGGNYPKNLDELVPGYMASVPTDPYVNGQPIRYQLENKGLLLYSVGPNGKDDGGRELWNEPEGDDIPIRMPHKASAK